MGKGVRIQRGRSFSMAIEFRENEVFEVAPGVWIRNMVDNAAWADLGNGVAVIDSLEDTQEMEKAIPAR